MAKLKKEKKKHMEVLLHTALKKDKKSKGIFQVAYEQLKDDITIDEKKQLVKAREFGLAGDKGKFEEIKTKLGKKYL